MIDVRDRKREGGADNGERSPFPTYNDLVLNHVPTAKPVHGYKLSNPPCGTWRVYRSHIGLRNFNRQELCQGQAATGAKGHPVPR